MGPVALLTLTGLFVGLEAAELTDNRCFQGKNMTWPEDECNSVIIAGFTCFGSSCPYNVLMNVSLPENVSVEMFRVKFDDACDCSCHCNCNRSQLGVFRFPVKSSESGVIHAESLEHQMDGGCYQYLSSTHNISSCCILFPGNDYFGKRPDLNNAVKPDRKEPAARKMIRTSIIGDLLSLLFYFLWCCIIFGKRTPPCPLCPCHSRT
ncbi:uncharacterized protein LOC117638926 isoform X1 [Thrips palmi]|uniref:Uncharacterized protein LOC117638926 isoform X1 n=1 Tax=Thrips palmi TaxID=161013 RepID=A0A6P8ZGG0_THRPL|nr:uncharacterized protein LOC117638926 isoform X1 [Thrips palmi]